MPLSERIRLNSGRPFIYTLVARVLVAVTLIFGLAFMHTLKEKSQNSNIYLGKNGAYQSTLNQIDYKILSEKEFRV